MKTLVLDQDPVARAMLREALGHAGHEVIIAADGEEAWRLLQASPTPDIALLDWHAEGLSGLELCRRAQGLGPVAPYVILLAAPGEYAASVAALSARADDVLVKPIRADLLDVRVRLASRAQAARRELVELRAEQANRSRIDQLTGVDDRQAISARLESELARAARSQTPLSALLVDIDQFRNINELFGHEAGDGVLASVASRLRRALRRYDAIGRWGAEEFLLLLPGCGATHTRQLADRLLQTIREEAIATTQGRVSITCSVGGLCLPFERPEETPEVDELAAALERGAGEAKRAGGNQAFVYNLADYT